MKLGRTVVTRTVAGALSDRKPVYSCFEPLLEKCGKKHRMAKAGGMICEATELRAMAVVKQSA